MKLHDFFSSEITKDDFIQQTNIIKHCDFLYHSDFFCKGNLTHFGIESFNDCISDAPNASSIIMCRFRDGEIDRLFESCRTKKKYKYIIVQTLIGDDGFLTPIQLSSIPENVIAIYSKNIRYSHEKLHIIPIGRDWRNTEENITRSFRRIRFDNYENLVYLNCSIETCPTVRGKVYELFDDKEWVTVRRPIKFKYYTLSHLNFIEDIHHHKFCFSPVGNALDCYRTWDSLFAKTIPIVDRNNHVNMYTELPILFTETWEEINQSYLEEKFVEMLDTEYNFELAFVSYWKNHFLEMKERYF